MEIVEVSYCAHVNVLHALRDLVNLRIGLAIFVELIQNLKFLDQKFPDSHPNEFGPRWIQPIFGNKLFHSRDEWFGEITGDDFHHGHEITPLLDVSDRHRA